MANIQPEFENDHKVITIDACQDNEFFQIDAINYKQVTININNVLNCKETYIKINILVSTVVEFKLVGNPTTGYNHKLVSFPLDSIVKLLKHYYTQKEHKKGMIGVGGIYTFEFLSVSTGKATAKIEYARFFEQTPDPLSKIFIEFLVVDPVPEPTKEASIKTKINS
ncbi:transmembrane protein [Cryptosporidium ryanae]|uniref:uncharacterized protein n=1 Tax=Cryptosporidium ryanae TaxID=515981 RepID=UPI003519F696|nr:transmembrane protein [Cryptosporidium ryanae]